MFIATDNILEQLVCSKCKKYLSVKPVKVYPNKAIKCGRPSCLKHFDDGVISLFGILAEDTAFRCVNRFDGCRQLLNYSEAQQHELTCQGRDYECPVCVDSFKGTAYYMYIHFKEHHEGLLIVKSSEILLNLDTEQDKTYLYRQNDFLFYINTRYNKSDGKFLLAICYLGTERDASRISQSYVLLSVDDIVIHKSKQTCCSVGMSDYVTTNIEEEAFQGNILICKVSLNTDALEQALLISKAASPINIKPASFKFQIPANQGSNPFRFLGTPEVQSHTGESKCRSSQITHGRTALEKQIIARSTRNVLRQSELAFHPIVNHFHKEIYWSITLMVGCGDKSFEEMRLKYYQNHPEGSLSLKNLNIATCSDNRISESLAAKHRLSGVPLFKPEKSFNPIIHTIFENQGTISTKLHSITAMLEYSDTSFEELRFKYYQNNYYKIGAQKVSSRHQRTSEKH